jgi:uncharacterized membrane protein
MISQTRAGDRDRVQAQHDYRVNEAAKVEIEDLQTSIARVEKEQLKLIISKLDKMQTRLNKK